MTADGKHKLFSVARTWAIAGNTFTQLVRMKVFYFLLIFSALIIGVNFFFLDFTFEQELKILKDVSFGAMSVFASVFAIVGTALLIPQDIEDRTLYTILTKPVPRFEYLLGKLLGVLLLLGVSLVLMSLLFFAVLYLRQHQILAEQIALLHGAADEADLVALRENIFAQGVQPALLIGVLAVFLKAAVAAGVALVVSTFASSTLFTIVVSLVVYFIGHTVSLARDYWFPDGAETTVLGKVATALVAIPFPDFQIFNVVDGLVTGEVLPPFLTLRLIALTGFYLAIYTLASWFVFSKKEL